MKLESENRVGAWCKVWRQIEHYVLKDKSLILTDEWKICVPLCLPPKNTTVKGILHSLRWKWPDSLTHFKLTQLFFTVPKRTSLLRLSGCFLNALNVSSDRLQDEWILTGATWKNFKQPIRQSIHQPTYGKPASHRGTSDNQSPGSEAGDRWSPG